MIDFLYSIDKSLFLLINQTLSNPVGDFLWPLITDYDKTWVVRLILFAVWVWLMVKGGRRGRTAALLLVPIIFLSDTLSSSVIKSLIHRPRPCHEIDGMTVVQGVHMLVNCGPGKSFPSSHAVNNFAVAFLFSFFYRKWTWAFVAWASLVALSRPAVGVHYPSDILGGAIIGILVAAIVIWVWQAIEKRYFSHHHYLEPDKKTW
jgi:undecaprenyl-diphosphatase